MKCYVYAFYNKKIGCYEKPIINNFPVDDFKTLVIRDVLVSTNEVKDKMAECELYELGQYDDELGEFNCHKPEFVMGLSELIVGKKAGDTNA